MSDDYEIDFRWDPAEEKPLERWGLPAIEALLLKLREDNVPACVIQLRMARRGRPE